jgi:hypothetical protein
MTRIVLLGLAAAMIALPAQAKTTRISGCVRAVPTMCKAIEMNGTNYIINTAFPSPALATGAVVTGEVTDKWSPCRGKWVEVKSWKPDPKAKCQ